MAKWDIEGVLGRTFYVEVKFDVMEAKTGNLAIEHFNTRLGKPSGIDATTADLWVVMLKSNQVWVARTADLKRYIQDVKPSRHISSGGDGNAAMYLYPSDQILDAVFRRIDDLDPWDVTPLLQDLLESSDDNRNRCRPDHTLAHAV